MGMKDRVGSRIQTIRKRRRLTQPQLADKIGHSVDALSNLERVISLPNFETRETLSYQLNVPVRDFFDFDSQDVDQKRAALISHLIEFAPQLDDAHLEIAVEQVAAMAAKIVGGEQ